MHELLTSNEIHDIIASTIGRTPASNIPTEDRFARVSGQASSCHGHVPSAATLFSRHVLTESQAWHHRAMMEGDGPEAADRPPLPKKPRNPWFIFGGAASHAGITSIKSGLWADMTDEEKLPYVETFQEISTQGGGLQ